MIFAIPSYKRAEKQETLDYLLRMEVPSEKIFIFVQTEDDHRAYLNRYSGVCNVIYRPAGGVAAARDNILSFVVNKDDVIMMDDDISNIAFGAKGQKFSEIRPGRLESVFEKLFEVNAQLRGMMFGLYPVWNEFFMSNDISTKVTVNSVLCFPKGFPLRFDESYKAKEDIELCGRILASGGRVVRFNNIAYKAKHRTNGGGACDVWHSDANAKAAAQLEMIYPEIFSVKANNPNEVRLVIRDEKKRGLVWIR